MKKSFRIQIGFDKYIPITKEELPKAYYSFINETKMITQSGIAIRGKDIITIEPNWNVVLGFNENYKLRPEDYGMIGRERKEKATEIMLNAKEMAVEVVRTGNKSLLENKDIKKLST